MKRLLLLCLISLVLSETVSDDDKGPAVHPKHSDSEIFCDEYFPWDEDSGNYYDDNSTNPIPQGVSDCVDTLLWEKYEERYYDRCCYLRFQTNGYMHAGCMLLTEEQFSDISESIRRIEEGDKKFWVKQAPSSKVYELDCSSSYLKIISLASILLALIF